MKALDLGKEKVFGTVIRLAVPAMIAQFINVLYSIVDRIFVGNIEGVGDLALAGVGVCAPVTTLISSSALFAVRVRRRAYGTRTTSICNHAFDDAQTGVHVGRNHTFAYILRSSNGILCRTDCRRCVGCAQHLRISRGLSAAAQKTCADDAATGRTLTIAATTVN